MKLIWLIAKREFLGFLRTPVAMVFLLMFYLISMVSAFFIVGLLDQNQASLQGFMPVLPWLLLVITPSTAMKLWSEQHESGSYTLMMTWPVTPLTWMLGKFLAGWALHILALISLAPLVVTIEYLGQPDYGMLWTSCLGAILLAGGFLAVSCFMAILARRQIIGFINSFLAILVLLMLGWGWLSEVLTGFLPEYLVVFLSYMGVAPYFEELSRGLVSTIALGYFMALMIASLGGCLSRVHTTASRRHKALLSSLILAVVVLGGARAIGGRLDLTAGQTLSLKPQSHDLISSLKEPLTIELFYSASAAHMPPSFRHFSQRVKTLFQQVAEMSENRVRLVLKDPWHNPDFEDQAETLKLEPAMAQNKAVYLGARFYSESHEFVWPYISPQQERNFEYEMVTALLKTQSRTKPQVGLYSSLISHDSKQAWSFVHKLKDFYHIQHLSDLNHEALSSHQVLVLHHPKGLTSKQLYAIDQYLMSGGRLLVFLDPFSRRELQQRYGTTQLRAGHNFVDVSSTLEPLLGHWGIDFKRLVVIGDLEQATKMANGRGGQVYYPLFIKTRQPYILPDPITIGVYELLFPEPGSLSFVGDVAWQRDPLISTSKRTAALEVFRLAFLSPHQVIRLLGEPQDQKHLAVKVSGLVSSAFSTADALRFQDGLNLIPHKSQSSLPVEVIVIADADHLADMHAYHEQGVGQPRNDNVRLLQNALEYLSGAKALQSLAGSQSSIRPYTKLIDFQNQAQEKLKKATILAQSQLKSARSALHAKFAEDTRRHILNLDPKHLQDVKALHIKTKNLLAPVKQASRTLQHELYHLKSQITAYNFTVGPWLIMLIVLIYWWWRPRVPKLSLKLVVAMVMVPPLSLAFGLQIMAMKHQKPIPQPTTQSLFELEDLAELKAVSFITAEGRIRLVRGRDQRWRSDSHHMALVNVDRLARFLLDFSMAKVLNRSVDRGAVVYGFQQSDFVVFEFSDGKQLSYQFGHRRAEGGVYMRVVGKKDIYLLDFLLKPRSQQEFWLLETDLGSSH